MTLDGNPSIGDSLSPKHLPEHGDPWRYSAELEKALEDIIAICKPLIYPYDTPPGILDIHDRAEQALEGK